MTELRESLVLPARKMKCVVEPPADDDRRKVEALAYFVVSPDDGPGYRIYEEEDVLVYGGVHALERALERMNYWYGYLGRVWGDPSPHGVSYEMSEFARLPNPNQVNLRIGRRNPAFGRSDMEQRIFQEAFEVVNRMLNSWNQEDEGVVDAYTVKHLRISRKQLQRVASALHVVSRVHEIVEVSVIKYWYDATWAGPQFPDLVLAEFPVNLPLEFQRSLEQVIAVEVMPLALC